MDYDISENITLDSITDNLAMLRNFDRIRQRIETTWGSKKCRKYMIGLVIDDRDRYISKVQGFPTEVVSALLNLIDLHDEAHPKFTPSKGL